MTTAIKLPSKTTIPTGQCYAGWHEGTKARDWRGTPVRTCEQWQTCPCECHERITNMFQVGEQERVLIENPEYHTPERTWYMPVYGLDYGEGASSSVALMDSPETLKRAAPIESTAVLGAPSRAFAPTPTGRTARGELEAQVLEVVTEWIIDPYCTCTPRFISIEIARVQKIPEPSTGAVNAVLDRWVKYGYCILERTPTRFVALTEAGKIKGLAQIKIEYKRAHR